MTFLNKFLWILFASVTFVLFQNCSPSITTPNTTTSLRTDTPTGADQPSAPTITPPSSLKDCRPFVSREKIGLTPSANLHIDQKSNLVIDGKSFRFTSGQQNCLYITNSTNITVRNSSFIGCYRGVVVENSSGVIIEDNYFENTVAGVLGLSSTALVVRSNRIKNIGGGNWYSMTTAFNQKINANAIAFNKMYGAGNEISCNLSLNIEGQSKSEDLMTTYQSQGTSISPILIQKNCLQGGGPSPSGGGLMIGDQGGQYITAQENILINVGQYSLAIAGGHHNKLLNNKIRAQERNGFPLDTGIYVHDYGNSLDGSGCSNHTVQGNQVSCIHGGTNCGAAKGNECGAVGGWENNEWGLPGTSQQGPDLSDLRCPFDF